MPTELFYPGNQVEEKLYRLVIQVFERFFEASIKR